jgi:hypothetical protein
MSKKQRKQIQQQEFIKQKQNQKASTVEEVLSPVVEAQEEDVTPKAPEVEEKKAVGVQGLSGDLAFRQASKAQKKKLK